MHEGALVLNKDGRWSLKDGYCWTCGDLMDIYDFYAKKWIRGVVEADDKGYYWRSIHCRMYIRLNGSYIARSVD